MADEDAHQWRNAIPEPEHRGDLHGAAPVGPKPPERDRRPEVVQAEGEPEDEKTADHGFLVNSSSATMRYGICHVLPGVADHQPLFSYYSGSAKANSALPWDDPSILGRNPSAQPPQPDGATMYCRPSTLYVDGLLWWPLPHWNCHSSSPLLASHALNSPVGSPPNTRSPPVVSSDEHMHRSLVQRHRSWPVRGS